RFNIPGIDPIQGTGIGEIGLVGKAYLNTVYNIERIGSGINGTIAPNLYLESPAGITGSRGYIDSCSPALKHRFGILNRNILDVSGSYRGNGTGQLPSFLSPVTGHYYFIKSQRPERQFNIHFQRFPGCYRYLLIIRLKTDKSNAQRIGTGFHVTNSIVSFGICSRALPRFNQQNIGTGYRFIVVV